MKKRIMSLLLTMLMLLNMIPVAFAEDTGVQQSTLQYSELYEGLSYGEEKVFNEEGKNVNTFVVSVDGDDDSLKVVTGVPKDETPLTAGLVQTTSGQALAAQQNGKNVLAAVNADFFHMGDNTAIQPCGITIKDGELLTEYYTGTNRVRSYFFGVKKDGEPVIGDKALYDEIADDLEQAVGGGPWLVTEGAVIDNSSDTSRHPRTAVGITADGDILLVVADGRTDDSAGFTFDELAKYMLSLGAVEALNLDGGGSSALVTKNSETYAFDVENHPSDGTERPVGNTLLVIDKDAVEHVGPDLEQADDGYYLIRRAADFKEINKAPNENYRLANDIVLDGEIIPSVSVVNGDFDGAGYTISGLTTDDTNGYALFGTLSESGSIHDLALTDVNITTGGSAAALVLICNGSIENVTVVGNITGGSSVAGLVGYMSQGGSIKKCAVAVNVKGSNDVAGLVGKMLYGCNVDSCYVNANVSGVTRVGGLTGYAVAEPNQADSYITNCIVRGFVKATNIEAGGIGGLLKVGVTNCVVADMNIVDTGTANAASGNVAGLLGAWCNGSRMYTGNVIQAGSITTESTNCVAHRIGYHSTNKSNNYVATTVTINGEPETGGAHDNNIGADATAEQLTSKSFYEGLGFDFENVFSWDDEAKTPILQDVDQTLEIPEVVVDNSVKISNISLSMGADESQMNFTWHCTTQAGGTLRIAKADELVDGAMPESAKEFEATNVPTNEEKYANKVTVTGLEAGVTYAYQVVSGETCSEVETFTTDDGGEFAFAYVGDPQIGASGNAVNDTTGWDNTLNIVAENEIFSDISFMLSAGDQVNTASDETQYDGYLDHEALKNLPVATVIGNHDSGSDAYSEHFNIANESAEYGTTSAGGDYWFVYNNVLFMVLNSNDQAAAEHKAFMEAAIADNPDVDWKIVTFHHAVYTVASHAEDGDILSRREALVPIFDELDIDVVLMGHDHVYCRTYMMDGLTPMTDASIYDDENYSSITNPEGILYVTANSGSGSKHYNIKSTVYPYSAVQNQEYAPNVSKVTVSEDQFTITTYRTSNMSVVDIFTIYHTEDSNDTGSETVPTEINADTVWSYLDDGTDPAGDSTAEGYDRTSWAAEDFDDSAWKTSKGSLGAKRGALGEVDGYMPDYLINQYKEDGTNVEAFFFRTKVWIEDADAIKQIQGNVIYDDSATVYINGTKVAGFDDEDITANLQYGGHNSSTAEGVIDITDEKILNLLHDGENVVAVEVHQGRVASSDIYFGMPTLTFQNEVYVEPVVLSNISLSMGADESQMNFTWHINEETAGKLLVSKSDELVNGAMPESAKVFEATNVLNNDSKYTNKVTVTGLEAGVTYAYQVVNGETCSEVETFTTDDGGEFAFAYVGDPQIGASGNATSDTTGWDNTLNIVVENEIFSDISFMLSAGDQVNTASSETQYDGYLDHEALKGLPVATVIGNHDSGSDAYSQHFNIANESTEYGTTSAGGDYWFVYNNVLFMVLNSNDQSAAEHKAFMEAAIADNPDVDWKIVTFHHAVYTVASHAEDGDILSRREALVPIFDELDIDVVLMGHDHVYCRTYMMDGLTPMTDASIYDDENYSSITNPEGILYVTANSGSGSKHYNIKSTEYPYSAVQNQEYAPNVSKVTVSEDQFTITTYRTSDMTVVDTFTINHHNHVYTATVTAPTCTEQGYTTYECECGETYVDDYVDALGHNCDKTVVAPTCTESGYTLNHCTNEGCDYNYVSDVTAATGHTCTDTVVAPTHDRMGYTITSCENCTFSVVGSFVEALEHEFVRTVTKEATCTTEGEVTFACECGESYTMAIPTTDHVCDETVVAPTCVNNGYTEHHCTNEGCDYSYISDVTAATGHTCTDTVVAPTHDRMGYTITSCENCTFSVVGSFVEALEHEFVRTVTKEATCTTEGEVTFACECGESYTMAIPTTDHVCDETVVAPTCVNNGYTEHHCTNEGCDYSCISDFTAPVGHQLVEGVCLGNGHKEFTCQNCDYAEYKPYNCPTCAYTDLDSGRWYHDATDFVLNEKIMIGVSATEFAPNSELTRGQLVTILYRVAGEPEVQQAAPFTDVAQDAYYADAVAWGYSQGIIKGVSATKFAPNAVVTREQTATFLYRFAGCPAANGDAVKAFGDADQISNFALDAMNWAVETGIINGVGQATLAPTDSSTRVQAAEIIYRYMNV